MIEMQDEDRDILPVQRQFRFGDFQEGVEGKRMPLEAFAGEKRPKKREFVEISGGIAFPTGTWRG
jgi:hypothetical protein